ncbi:hypothetical protein ASE70_15090 [Sphingomonas sp. Leaf22]|uniref:hypothetical protein n=1 Tax=Sphingomonas sp. Leaf22 TaxID=1735687 RepID=UPI0006FABBF1|nr:hypothetical protein [Sphingomonas sp. Leaf22]KQM92237.1 hypothetical protein ASE70_15090 [Sphingomonas sp. Leaf22]
MKETTPRLQRIYLRFSYPGDGNVKLHASLTPPDYDEPLLVLLSRGVMPSGQPFSVLMVSDPSQNDALRGKAATVRVGAVAAGPVGSAPKVANSGTDTAATLDFTLPAPRDGQNGLSAYEVARAAGYGGTATQWLTTLVGADGKSAYQLAREAGYGGTLTQWLASLVGPPATTLLGTVTLTEAAALVAISAGTRRLIVATPETWGVKPGDDIAVSPISIPAGYATHDVAVAGPNSLSVGVTAPLLAIGAKYSIQCRVRRFN